MSVRSWLGDDTGDVLVDSYGRAVPVERLRVDRRGRMRVRRAPLIPAHVVLLLPVLVVKWTVQLLVLVVPALARLVWALLVELWRGVRAVSALSARCAWRSQLCCIAARGGRWLLVWTGFRLPEGYEPPRPAPVVERMAAGVASAAQSRVRAQSAAFAAATVVEPAEPTEPTEPTVPAEKTEPTEKTEPAERTEPTEPAVKAEPPAVCGRCDHPALAVLTSPTGTVLTLCPTHEAGMNLTAHGWTRTPL